MVCNEAEHVGDILPQLEIYVQLRWAGAGFRPPIEAPCRSLKITERNAWATATHILNSWVNDHGQAEQISYFLFTIGK